MTRQETGDPLRSQAGGALQARYDVVVVGAGHAGAQVAIALRQSGFAGSIALIGAEAHPPYERPPLSKDYLAGDKSFERLLIKPDTFWGEHDIALVLGARVVAVDPLGRSVTLSDGRCAAYGDLVWAAGAAPRPLTCMGADRPGVLTLRGRDDVDALLARLPSVRDVVVVGGGFIGLEAAAALVKQGKHVKLVEGRDRVLTRVAAEPISRFVEAEHRAHGVEFHLGRSVSQVLGDERGVTSLVLDDGQFLDADLVIVGIGVAPQVAPLLAAGATGQDGVVVDEACRTSLPHVYAVGDCAAYANRFADGAIMRLESVQNARDQALVAAKAIQGQAAAYDAAPWFWSNQYDLRLQTIGLSLRTDDFVVRGDPATRSFSVIYLRDGRVTAIDSVNAAKDYVQGRALVVAGMRLAAGELADASRSLKDLVSTASAA